MGIDCFNSLEPLKIPNVVCMWAEMSPEIGLLKLIRHVINRNRELTVFAIQEQTPCAYSCFGVFLINPCDFLCHYFKSWNKCHIVTY